MTRDLRASWRTFLSYQGVPLVMRAYVAARLAIAPLGALETETRHLRGRMLSLGCGLGVIERALVENNTGLCIDGIELDADRVGWLQATQPRAPRVASQLGDATSLVGDADFDAVLLCDVLHHLDVDGQKAIATVVAQSLRCGGVCIVKDLDVQPRWKHRWNQIHDRVVAGPAPIYCRSPDETAALFNAEGLDIDHLARIDRKLSPYAHYLLRCHKP